MRDYDGFEYLVLSLVSEIPVGKVLTYGKLAKMAGHPQNARLVGRVLSNASLYGDYPCHRVVNASGRLAPNWDEQRSLLEEEGVSFTPSGNVSLKNHLWE